MTFADFKARQAALYAASSAAGDRLRAYPRGPMGLTPDEIKASPEWRRDRAAYDRAAAELRAFNATWVPVFRRDLQAERRARTI